MRLCVEFSTVRRVVAVLCLVAVAGPIAGAEPTGDRPNIILIMSDDIGIGGFGCYGGDGFRTPRIDALAATGVRFEHCFAMPLCGPSRACLLTGRYAFRTGMTGNNTGRKVSPDREVSIARVLKEAGYATAFAGKWNQLSYLRSPEEARTWGWDEFLMWDSAFSPGRYWEPKYLLNAATHRTGVEDRYGPDLCHDFAADFITRHRNQPFFLYYPTVLVHGPIMRTPDSKPDGDSAKQQRRQLRADMVEYLDKTIGKLVDTLADQKLLERTVILFTSDNGTPGSDTIGGRTIEGQKNTLQEGGSRVPLVVSWRGTIPAGRVCRDLVDFSDFFATLVELSGAAMPGGVTIDGRSFAPQLRGQPGKPREWVYVQLNQHHYVRDPRWKLYDDGTLCDMRDAPFREAAVTPGSETVEATTARKRLGQVLSGLRVVPSN